MKFTENIDGDLEFISAVAERPEVELLRVPERVQVVVDHLGPADLDPLPLLEVGMAFNGSKRTAT